MSSLFVYVTAASTDEAAKIGRTLVEERLCACANVLAPVRSIYWWKGAVEEGNEAVLVMKTTEARLSQLTERVRALHSYDCPCVVALPIAGGNPAFLDWIASETNSANG